MPINSYAPGNQIRIECTFKVGSTLTDPTTITLRVRDPAGVVTAYTYAAATVTRVSVGLYRKDLSISTKGKWTYRWEGTGACEAANPDGVIEIADSVFV